MEEDIRKDNTCKCGAPINDYELHSCPYQCEVNNECNDDYCNCCQQCIQNCNYSI